MADPYQTLGLKRGASESDIRAAYRKLAKQYHPDLNAGRADAAERFKAINRAHDLLSDPTRRARYDRGEIDADGNETAAHRFRQQAGRGNGWGGAPGGMGGGTGMGGGFTSEDLDALFGQAFGADRATGAAAGRDMRHGVSVSFREAALGTSRRVLLADGREVEVAIRPGTKDGEVLRLKGQGRRGARGAGDALVEVSVAPDRLFRREGDDIVMDLPLSLKESVLGASVEVPTLTGKVRLTIPPGAGSGARLRLKGRGIAGGNLVVVLKPVLPAGEEPALAAFLKSWQPLHDADPRAELDRE